jgi:hypothetical protein
MALTPDQERALFEYVRDGQNTRIVNGDKLDTLSADIRLQNTAIQLHFQKDELTNQEFREALKGHGARLTELEDREEITSQHSIAELKAQLKERQQKDHESSTWLKRWGVQTFVAIMLMLFSTLLGYLIHHLI